MNTICSAAKVRPVSGAGNETAIEVSAPLWQQAQLGGRAIGAIFFAVFGGIWVLIACGLADRLNSVAIALVTAVTLLLAATAVRTVRQNRGAMAALRPTPAHRRMRRQFLAVNIAQWVAMGVAANLLYGLGLGQWIMPAIMLIVGLHFFPLAHTFRHRPHYWTGLALTVTALICPLAGRSDPWAAEACLAAGAILWLSALWSLRPTRS